MNHFHFTSFLTSNAQFDEQFIEKLVQNCHLKTVSKGTLLLQAGQHCKHSFFVEKGLLKMYSISPDGKEHIIQFAPENWLITDRDSSFFNKVSTYYIEALEESTVLLIEEKLLDELAQKDADFAQFNNRLLHNHIRQLQKRISMLLGASAEERYLDFIETYPDILLRVPQTLVASYLGITPESLSRIRKKLAEKNFKGR